MEPHDQEMQDNTISTTEEVATQEEVEIPATQEDTEENVTLDDISEKASQLQDDLARVMRLQETMRRQAQADAKEKKQHTPLTERPPKEPVTYRRRLLPTYRYEEVPTAALDRIETWYEFNNDMTRIVTGVNKLLHSMQMKQINLADLYIILAMMKKDGRIGRDYRSSMPHEYSLTQFKGFLTAWTQGCQREQCKKAASDISDRGSNNHGNKLFRSLNLLAKALRDKHGRLIANHAETAVIEAFNRMRLVAHGSHEINGIIIPFAGFPIAVRKNLAERYPSFRELFMYPEILRASKKARLQSLEEINQELGIPEAFDYSRSFNELSDAEKAEYNAEEMMYTIAKQRKELMSRLTTDIASLSRILYAENDLKENDPLQVDTSINLSAADHEKYTNAALRRLRNTSLGHKGDDVDYDAVIKEKDATIDALQASMLAANATIKDLAARLNDINSDPENQHTNSSTDQPSVPATTIDVTDLISRANDLVTSASAARTNKIKSATESSDLDDPETLRNEISSVLNDIEEEMSMKTTAGHQEEDAISLDGIKPPGDDTQKLHTDTPIPDITGIGLAFTPQPAVSTPTKAILTPAKAIPTPTKAIIATDSGESSKESPKPTKAMRLADRLLETASETAAKQIKTPPKSRNTIDDDVAIEAKRQAIIATQKIPLAERMKMMEEQEN